MPKVDVLFQDSTDTKKWIPDESVDLVVAGLPKFYYPAGKKKTYLTRELFGAEAAEDLESFLGLIRAAMEDSVRVLKNDHYLMFMCTFSYDVKGGRQYTAPVPLRVIDIGLDLGLEFIDYTIWEPSREGSARAKKMYNNPVPGNYTPKQSMRWCLLFRKYDKGTPLINFATDKQIEAGRLERRFLETCNSCVWKLPREKYNEEYGLFSNDGPTPMSEDVYERYIKLFSFPGDTVYIPFAGTGTGAIKAYNNGRNAVMSEIAPRFIEFMLHKDRLGPIESDVTWTFGDKYEADVEHTKPEVAEELKKRGLDV